MREGGATVAKYNPYHDERGRFTTPDNAVEPGTPAEPDAGVEVTANEYNPTMTDADQDVASSPSASRDEVDDATITPVAAGGLTVVHEAPKDDVEFRSGDGTVFLAPPKADFNEVFSAGRTNGSSSLAGNAAIGHFGTFDFQRDGNTFYSVYTDAWNYAVGAYMAGAVFSLQYTIFIGKNFARAYSSNAGTQSQEDWWKRGCNDATTSSGPFSPSP